MQKCIVISLASAPTRQERFLKRASSHDLDLEVFEAHTGISGDLVYDETTTLRFKGRTLHSAELGTYSSHYHVWKSIIDRDIDGAFIFEDDVVFDWPVLKGLKDFLDFYPRVQYLRLYAKRPCKMQILTETLPGGRALVDYRGYAYGTQAYFIRRSAALTFIERLRRIRMAIDDAMDRSWDHGVPNLAAFPFPAFEENVPSTIGTDRFQTQKTASRWELSRLQQRVFGRIQRQYQMLTRFGFIDRLEQLT